MNYLVMGRQQITRLLSLRPQVGGGVGVRWWCDGTSEAGGEARLVSLLRQRFPQAAEVEVQDISGGCGAMYEVWVEDSSFKGLSRVKQHRLITEALKAEIRDMHGLRITTSIPSDT